MRFKVGDKVRVKKGLETYQKYGGVLFSPSMRAFEGEVAEILEMNAGVYLLNIDGKYFDWTDEMLEPAEFTIDDLKNGDIATRRDGEKFMYRNKILFSLKDSGCGYGKNCFNKKLEEKDGYKEHDIIKVERPVRYRTVYERKILNDKEKEYLSNVIRPFKAKVIYIRKIKYDSQEEYISIYTRDYRYVNFPDFRKGTMYKNMEENRAYTLEELGL